jgi:hypothetical protein
MFSLATITRSSALAWAEREAQRRAGADPAALRSSRVRLRPDSRYQEGPTSTEPRRHLQYRKFVLLGEP